MHFEHQHETAPGMVTEEGQLLVSGSSPVSEDGGRSGIAISALRLAELDALSSAELEARRLSAAHSVRRAAEIARSTPGRSWPLWRLREAWAVYRHRDGLRLAYEGADVAGPAGDPKRIAAVIAAWERYSAARPAGWPAGGAAALTVMAARGGARIMLGDIARMEAMTRDMAAALSWRDPGRKPGAPGRARRRQRRDGARPTTGHRFAFRKVGVALPFELPSEARQRIRTLLLLAGLHPGDYSTLEHAELAVIQAQADGLLPDDVWPLPADQREVRRARGRRADGGRSGWWLGTARDLYDVDVDGAASRADRWDREQREGLWALPPTWPSVEDCA